MQNQGSNYLAHPGQAVATYNKVALSLWSHTWALGAW